MEIIGEPSTSSTVSTRSRCGARGLRADHSRAATATCANCSGVVPNSCMWRFAMSPIGLIGCSMP
ncbi:hypothetical protein [Pseudolysinimonas kribbensis]|uniref:hypothetical protein n=1 Tax=Pseudolysinimonas kribbensis TaxID=433641 RepID=UPI0024E1387B|nr:hypothetical protein [Pseudolysinimonas kribbensis]